MKQNNADVLHHCSKEKDGTKPVLSSDDFIVSDHGKPYHLDRLYNLCKRANTIANTEYFTIFQRRDTALYLGFGSRKKQSLWKMNKEIREYQ